MTVNNNKANKGESMKAKPEMVLWATRKGDAPWQEQLITSTTDPEHFRKAKQWAEANGFVNLRTSDFVPGEMPNFEKAVIP